MYAVTDDFHTIREAKGTDDEILLANFTAHITRETKYDDGIASHTVLTIEGRNKKENFPRIEVPTEKYAAMTWVLTEWGIAAVISPGQQIKELLRTAIQLASNPLRETVYTHTGWAKIKGKKAYLHTGGAITKNGNTTEQRVQLPNDLEIINLAATPHDPKLAATATLSLLTLAPKEIMFPIVASIFSPLHGTVDFAFHVAGRTGTFKSELAAIVQQHYGSEATARNLPGSWSSTPNALEAQAFRAKNAIMVVDDFIPSGSSWMQRAYQKTADQLIRGQGNQAGRARLRDDARLQQTMFPRGMLFSTGEDTPDGHSVRARMMILELAPGDITTERLTKAQNRSGDYVNHTSDYVQYIAGDDHPGDVSTLSQKIRDQHLTVGHTRTPATIGALIAVFTHWTTFLETLGTITADQARKLTDDARKYIVAAGEKQDQYLIEADPCEAWCETIRAMLQGHVVHFRTKDGGIPTDATKLGWTEETSLGDIPTFKSHGKCLGWVDWNSDEMYIDATSGYHEIRRHSHGAITFTKQTMTKRLKDAGLLTKTDETRQRNTVRVRCEAAQKTVIAMAISTVLDSGEKPNV